MLKIRILLGFAVSVVLCAALDVLSTALSLAVFGVSLAAAALLYVFVPYYYRSVVYEIRGEKIIKSAGVLFRRRTVILKSQILYNTALSTPLLRKLGLRSLHFYGCGAKLVMSALDGESAQKILESLDDK